MCGLMISIVTIAKQFQLKGIIGSSTKMISVGVFFITGSLLFQTLLSFVGDQIIDPILEPILDLISILGIVFGIGIVFFGLWKISVMFDEIRSSAQKHVTLVQLEDESK